MKIWKVRFSQGSSTLAFDTRTVSGPNVRVAIRKAESLLERDGDFKVKPRPFVSEVSLTAETD